MIATAIFYGAVGALAGVLSGLFGIGGGVIIVPLLLWVLPTQGFSEAQLMLSAIATSLATIVPTSISAVYAHHRRGAVQWAWVRRLAPGVLIGAGLGAWLAEQLPSLLLKHGFAVFLLYVALRLWQTARAVQQSPVVSHAPVSHWVSGIGVLIGALSAVLGIGGGTLSVPYLARQGLSMPQAAATSSACGIPLALAAATAYVWLGRTQINLPDPHWGYVYVPALFGIAICSTLSAPFGSRLAHRLPALWLKRGFAVLLVMIAARLLSQTV